MMWIYTLVVVLQAAYCVLLADTAARGTQWFCLCSRRQTINVVLPACSLIFAILADISIGELCSSGALATKEYALGLDGTSTPLVVFSAFFLQGVMQATVGDFSKHGVEVNSALAIWALTTLFYARQYAQPSCLLPSRWAAGSGTLPLHYVLWNVSVSAQCLTLYGFEQAFAERTKRRSSSNLRAEERAARGAGGRAAPAHRWCCTALFSVNLMIWGGALADVLPSTPAALGSLLVSFSSFYVMLTTGIAIPLRTAWRHFAVDKADTASLLEWMSHLLSCHAHERLKRRLRAQIRRAHRARTLATPRQNVQPTKCADSAALGGSV